MNNIQPLLEPTHQVAEKVNRVVSAGGNLNA